MKILIKVSDTQFDEYCNKIGAVNGTNAVSRARKQYKRYVQELWTEFVEHGGYLDSAPEILFNKYYKPKIVKVIE